MVRRPTGILVFVTALLTAVVAMRVYAHAAVQKPDAPPPQAGGWTLPADAEQKKSPLTVDAKVLAAGKSVFKNKCQKCHGATGLGDGPDADPDHQSDMDLTNASRASKNPEGVMFYKVSNGRKKPKMPAFKDELTEQQIWSVIAYAQSLRK
jgi:mono/diheme cytochrome c family protein